MVRISVGMAVGVQACFWVTALVFVNEGWVHPSRSDGATEVPDVAKLLHVAQEVYGPLDDACGVLGAHTAELFEPAYLAAGELAWHLHAAAAAEVATAAPWAGGALVVCPRLSKIYARRCHRRQLCSPGLGLPTHCFTPSRKMSTSPPPRKSRRTSSGGSFAPIPGAAPLTCRHTAAAGLRPLAGQPAKGCASPSKRTSASPATTPKPKKLTAAAAAKHKYADSCDLCSHGCTPRPQLKKDTVRACGLTVHSRQCAARGLSGSGGKGGGRAEGRRTACRLRPDGARVCVCASASVG